MTVTSFVRATAAAGIALLVAGCTGSADGSETSAASSTPAPATTSSSTSSAPPTTTTSTSATTQSMAEKYPETPAGAEAFVRAFFGAYNTASQDPSKVSEFVAFTDPACESCKRLSDEVRGWGRSGAKQTGAAVQVARIRPDGDSVDAVQLIALKQLAGTVKKPNGEIVQQIVAKDVKSAMTIQWTPTGWTVVRLQPYQGEV
ncbi:hypothetical protein [Barrientosiimonas humi]